MKRIHGNTEQPIVRPVIPATSDQPEPEAQQALAGPVADAPVEPAATDHAPMVFPGPFAYVPRPPAMQDSALRASSASAASSGQEGEGCSTSTTSSASATAPSTFDDNPQGVPPLIFAAAKGKLSDLDVLLQNPATNINQIDSKFGISALMAAAGSGQVTVLARLIAAGADIDLVHPREHSTALIYASLRNKPDAVACLLDAGAQVNFAAGPKQQTALMAAAFRGYVEVVNMLVRHKDIVLDQTDATGQSALHFAVASNKAGVVKCLLAAGVPVNLATAGQGITALTQAAFFGHVDALKPLLAHRGIALDATDAKGMNALHWATQNNKPDVVACLLAAGANMTVVNSDGSTALRIAVRKKHVAIIEVLSHHGVVLPYIDDFDAAHAVYAITLADLTADQKLPADPEQNPLGLVAPNYLEQPFGVIDELVAVLESGQDLLRWLRAKGIRMASALPVVECLAGLAGTWAVLANNGQAATAQQKRLVCAAALSRLSVLTGKGEALERYKAAGISAAGLERLSALAMRQVEKIIAVSEQVLTTTGSAMLDNLLQDCLAKTSFGEVDTEALSASLVSAGWLAPLAQAVVRAWTSVLDTLEAEPFAIAAGSTVKQITQGLRENIERRAPGLFAQAMQRELAERKLLKALRTWVGDTSAAEGLDMLFMIQCDQFRQYCEQLGGAA